MKFLIVPIIFSIGSNAMGSNDAAMIPIPVIPQSIDVINIPTTNALQIASLVTEGLFGAGQEFQIVPPVHRGAAADASRAPFILDTFRSGARGLQTCLAKR